MARLSQNVRYILGGHVEGRPTDIIEAGSDSTPQSDSQGRGRSLLAMSQVNESWSGGEVVISGRRRETGGEPGKSAGGKSNISIEIQ
jgi:hypothetical protein